MKLLLIMATAIFLQSCYSVTTVGNCRYYKSKFVSSKYRTHKPIGF